MARDVDTIYEVPLVYKSEGLDEQIIKRLHLEPRKQVLDDWVDMVHRLKNPEDSVTIALVGKYVGLVDSYKSLYESLVHGGIANRSKVDVRWIDAEEIEANGPERYLADVDGVLVPGGFGSRGSEGKIAAIGYARRKKVPFFGICLGMQLAVVEYMRSICGCAGANSSEFDLATPYPVIYLMEQWFDFRKGAVQERTAGSDKGGTMRLGAYPCHIAPGSFAWDAYRSETISERHRHRYEFNNAYREMLTRSGLSISGTSPDGELVEIVEIKGHPWFLGCQFHPEFKSRPRNPHPLFKGFIKAALKSKNALLIPPDSK
jgi:CTP synthase